MLAHTSISVEIPEVPLGAFLDTELGPAEAGEPEIAPMRAYELLWRQLFKKYPKDCMGMEKERKEEEESSGSSGRRP